MSRGLAFCAALALAAIFLVAGLARAPEPAKPGFLGLQFAPLSRAQVARAPLLSGGASIVYVYPGSPADKAKLRTGEIVTAIDGRAVETATHAADMVDARRPGARISLGVLDLGTEDSLPQKVVVALADGPAPSKKVYTVRPPRTLAREWSFGPTMAANAAWAPRISRGAINPYPLKVLSEDACSAVAPDGWRIVAHGAGDYFFLASAGGHIRSMYRRARLSAEGTRAPEAFVAKQIGALFGQMPQLGASRSLENGFSAVAFGTSNNYAGFALYRIDKGGKTSDTMISLRIAGVPATEVEGLQPYAGAVALSIRCGSGKDMAAEDADVPPTAISTRCLAGACDESDLAGAYNAQLHTGYVHAPNGENFLIDPRKDVWATGPEGPGTYRQNNGLLEKLEPGRTN